VAARVSVRPESLRERLRRLSVVFSIELRLKIVTELFMRPMGATQFFREFGGGSPSRVAKNFQCLAQEGWLRYVGEAPAVGGRGTEKLYRATELAFFDTETWAQLPYSLRVASSWNIFNQVVPRLREAIGAENDAEHLPLTRRVLWLDATGWSRVIEALNQQFSALYEHQQDAHLRAMQLGEPLFRADVFLIGFEIPPVEVGTEGAPLPVVHRESLMPFYERLSRVLADDACFQIVSELNEREMTVLRFHREFQRKLNGISVRSLARRFEMLEEIRWLAVVDTLDRQGRGEPIYRATMPTFESRFKKLDTNKQTEQLKSFGNLCDEARDSMRAGIFDIRTDRSVAWCLLNLDLCAFKQVLREMDALQKFLIAEQDRASERLARSGEEPLAMSVNLAAFQSLKEPAKAP
jgi:DNA-binding HxlR family transcriptional regulator